jgi:monoamine oxidase
MSAIFRVFGAGERRVVAPETGSERRTEVAIVGAGIAGLMAARRLADAGVDVLVLEARERVGGRIYTRPGRDGTLLDLGAQWIGPTQRHLTQLATELGVATFKTYDTGNNVEYRKGQHTTYSGPIPTADPVASADIIEAMLNLTTMATQVPLDAPWQAPDAAVWDTQTAGTWIDMNVASDGARNLLTLAVQAVFSAEPHDLSLLHVLFYIHSAGGLIDLLGVTAGAQESRFVGGAQQVPIKLAEALGERVLLGVPIGRVTQDETSARLEGDAISVRADRAIITLPPALAGRLRYTPQLPGLRDQLTQRMPMGTVIKVHCIYDTPFWREAGLTGQASSDSGAVRITFDNSPEDGSRGVLLGFIEGDEGRSWGQRSAEERRAEVLACLVRYFGEAAGRPTDYVEQSWVEEEFTRGCYAGYMPPGVWTAYGEALRAPVGRLHWAGTETATVWNGYMEGALLSGERAAAEVLAALGRPVSAWARSDHDEE